MVIKYANKTIEDYFTNYDLMKRELPFEWVKQIKKHIDNLSAANNFGDFLKLGVGHPEQLKGNYKNIRYSLRIAKNARLIIELDKNDQSVTVCTDLEVEGVCDYHGKKNNWYIP